MSSDDTKPPRSGPPDADETAGSPRPGTEPEHRVIVFWEGGGTSRRLEPGTSLRIGRAPSCDIQIPHTSVSRTHAVLYGGESPAIEDLSSANGTLVNGAPLASGKRIAVADGDVVQLGAALAFLKIARSTGADPGLTGGPSNSEAELLLPLIAASDIATLILGETGVGKSHFAERIHRASARRARPFRTLNCGAFPESLLEAELFGYERGAFTGAVAPKPGVFEAARGGTVFLDEIGDAPPAIQVRLLHVLERREVMRLGAREPVSIDVRFVSATNHDVDAMVAQGLFRKDLYYRLNGFTVAIAPLRDRPDEIPELARALASPVVVSAEAIAMLQTHPLPGNIRELRNILERAIVLSGGKMIAAEHLPEIPFARPTVHPSAKGAGLDTTGEYRAVRPLRNDMLEHERRRIEQALEETDGNQTAAAVLLRISRRTLLRRLDEHGLPRPLKR